MADLVKVEERLKARGAGLHVVDPQMDTATPAGRLVLNMIASIAQFEREIMLTRQREGIARAKGEGLYKGRRPRLWRRPRKCKRCAPKGSSERRSPRSWASA